MKPQTFYAVFSNGKELFKILFFAHSITHAESIKIEFSKKNKVYLVLFGKAYKLSQIGENISTYKFINQ